MVLVLAVAAIAVLAAILVVSLGHGGEMARFAPSVPPLRLPAPEILNAADLAQPRLPMNLLGYDTGSVHEVLGRLAEALNDRDARIAMLEQRVAELLSRHLRERQALWSATSRQPRTTHEPPELAAAVSDVEEAW